MKVDQTDYLVSSRRSSRSLAVGEQAQIFVFGHTPAMQDIKRRVLSAAETDLPVLLQGECGTGKSVCAQIIHQSSTRSENALVEVNCPAIPTPLLDSELFGYNKGTFLGASGGKQGKIEQAHRGTLILNEIGSLDSFSQSKILQVLQDGTFIRAGDHTSHNISTRLISITNTDLRQKVQAGYFDSNLLYQINSVTINLPPLRERLEDLPTLISCFTARHTSAFGIKRASLSRQTLHLMCEYHWPGNLRELDNILRSYILLGNEEAITAELAQPLEINNDTRARVNLKKPFSLKRVTKHATRELEQHIILAVLQANGWNRQKTAKWLQISYRSLLYKLHEVELMKKPISDNTPDNSFESSITPSIRTANSALPFQVQ